MCSFHATESMRVRHPVSKATYTQGFTIIELMVVVAILVILIAIAGPDFRNLIVATRIKNTSFDVFSALVHARSEAVTRNTRVTITPAAGGWADGWTVTESGGTVIRQQSAYPSVAISLANAGSFVPAGTISFNGMGRLTAAAAPAFSLTATGALDKSKRCIVIDSSGRPVTKEGTCP
jgi:type IV fimbrial biogenesis protein FimT